MKQENEELLVKISDFGIAAEDVLFLGLIGSSTNDDHVSDQYSDIDLILVSSNAMKYYREDAWLRSIDEVWFTFTESAPDINYWERRCIFKDGLDVDFVIVDADKLKTDSGKFPVLNEICRKSLRVVVDKNQTKQYVDRLIVEENTRALPTRDEFVNVVHDFYFHCLWSIKKCLRGEYWVALQCVNGYLKNKTLTMIEWYERSIHGTGYGTFYNGRFLEKWVEPSLREDIEHIFSRYDKDEIIKAIIANKKFFTKIATRTAEKNGFDFPNEQVAKLSEWINAILPTSLSALP